MQHAGLKEPGWRGICNKCLYAQDKPAAPPVVKLESVMQSAQVKKRFRTVSFDSYVASTQQQKETLQIVKDFATNFNEAMEIGKWLLFAGNVGTGKGHLAISILREVIKQKHTARYEKVRPLLRRIKDSWSKGVKESESDIINKLVGVDLLVLDEIGVQFGTKTEQDVLYEILDGRHEEQKPVVATTNLSYEEMQDILGVRIMDRFLDKTSDSRVVVFDWESFRTGSVV
ncbi:MAG: ATP-binding protein [Deltaproteobacteria bacterium]|nr:ATP-binding protein [Deltaproteobacteria bacterium]